MMRQLSLRAGLALSLAMTFTTGCGGGGDDGDDGMNWPPLFEPKPECQGDAITPFSGDARNIISYLEIGDLEDGFDLDGERDQDCTDEQRATGMCNLPDNKLAAVGNLAQDAINESFADYSLLIPFEFFDLAQPPAADTCVKFALYLGSYTTDGDMDGDDTSVPDGDCNDHVMGINRNATEVVGDRIDNDCDGVADRGMDGTDIVCNPFDLVANPEAIGIDPLSLMPNGEPVIAFTSGEIVAGGATGLLLRAGPGLFSVAIPVTDALVLDLRITGATIEAEVVSDASGTYLRNGRLGGVIDAQTADKIMGLDVKQIGLTPDKTLLDATFANLLGPLLALPRASDEITMLYPNCRTPDIDVDGDGLEAFCDSTSESMMPLQSVDVCIDGDGTEHRDMNGVNCTEAVDGMGRALFRDGISVEINFETVPAGMFSPL